MNLQELGARRPTQQIARVIEHQAGRKIDFDLIGPKRALGMLSHVQTALREHRMKPAFHTSERNPAYMQLVMMEQALTARLQEVNTGGVTPMPGAGATGAAPTSTGATVGAPVNPAQLSMQLAKRKKELQDALRAAQDQVREIQKQISQPMAMAENRQRISESDVQQAQVTLASQDMIDQLQKMIEQISEMQFKDLPALAESIKNDPNLGQDTAMQYQSQVASALTQLLVSVDQGKKGLEAAQGVLTGQAPMVPGDTSGHPPLPDDNIDIDADVDVDAELPMDGEDSDAIDAGAALGRERR